MRLIVAPVAGVELAVIEPRPRPVDMAGWCAQVARGVAVPPRTLTTVDGWPFVLYEGAARMVAVYELLSSVAAVVAHAAGESPLAEQREPLLEALLAARPDWHGAEIVALSELWESP